MKKLILLAIVLISISASAQRVLTSEERQTLLESADFKEKCRWASFDYAAYWSIHDGGGLSNEAERIKWAKDRIFSVAILKNGITDENISQRFLNASKGKQFTIGTAPQSESVLLAAWITANAYDEFVGQYFTLLGDDINFSVGN